MMLLLIVILFSDIIRIIVSGSLGRRPICSLEFEEKYILIQMVQSHVSRYMDQN